MKEQQINTAKQALLGTAIGDAFGETFFGPTQEIEDRIYTRTLSDDACWYFTDDTIMSIAIYQSLEKYAAIEQDFLANTFANNYQKDTYRGYGGTMHSILRDIGAGKDWRSIAPAVFDGMGSMGNGAAMRAGVIGGYFVQDFEQLKAAAVQSAAVTHAHMEAQVGAMAVALAAGLAANQQFEPLDFSTFLSRIIAELPPSDTQSKINKALHLSSTYSIATAVSVLGNGLKMTAQDTVPFALWCAAAHLDDFEAALWKAVAGLGDRDTICAIVGSIVILSAKPDTLPASWLEKVEKIEGSVFWG